MELFSRLRRTLKENYGINKNSINFIPFENWRQKLKGYKKDFSEEYRKNLDFLRGKLGLSNLKKVENSNKKLILFVGIPGAGKTTLSKRLRESIPNTILLKGHDIVDFLELYSKKNIRRYKDRLRKRGFSYPDPWYISYCYQESLTSELLDLGYNVIFDDNIRTRINRRGYYNLAKEKDSSIIFIQINAPFKVSFEREEDNPNKLKFLANMVFQSEDFSAKEKKEYKIIFVDGTLKPEVLERKILCEIR